MPKPKDPTEVDKSTYEWWPDAVKQFDEMKQSVIEAEMLNRLRDLDDLCKTAEDRKNLKILQHTTKACFFYKGLIQGFQIGKEAEKSKGAARVGEGSRVSRKIAGIIRDHPTLSGSKLWEKIQNAGVQLPATVDSSEERTRRTVVGILTRNPKLSANQICERLESVTALMPKAWHKELKKKSPDVRRYLWTAISTVPELKDDLYAYLKRCRADAAKQNRLRVYQRLVSEHAIRRKESEESTKEMYEYFERALTVGTPENEAFESQFEASAEQSRLTEQIRAQFKKPR